MIQLKVNEALAAKNLSLLQLDSFLTLDTTESIVLSVNKGLGLSFSSTTIASTISETVSVPIKDINIEQGLYIVRDKTHLTTAARNAFWDFLTTSKDAIQEKVILSSSKNKHKAKTMTELLYFKDNYIFINEMIIGFF